MIIVAVLFVVGLFLFAAILLRTPANEHYCAHDGCHAPLTTRGQVGLAFCDTHLFLSTYGARV